MAPREGHSSAACTLLTLTAPVDCLERLSGDARDDTSFDSELQISSGGD